MTKKKVFWTMFICFTLLVIPFLGIYDFNTEGEPREALVACDMLESGNWILPRNQAGELTHQPPFFHWCVAAVSAIRGGVNEFTARFPSAVAFIALCLATFSFFVKRRNMFTALLTACITFTTYELHRQGFNCRVDMVFTCCMVGSLYLFYRWYERDMKGVPWLAVLLLSLSALTKGPAMILISCLAMTLFLLLRRVSVAKTLLWMLAIALLSLVLPTAWYYAAYQQGGDAFLTMAWHDTVGQLIRSVSDFEPVSAWLPNVLFFLMGFLPWCFLLIISLFTLPYRSLHSQMRHDRVHGVWLRVKFWFRTTDPIHVFSFSVIIVVLFFCCISESKRSIHLMPLYPFLSFFIARYVYWLVDHRNVAIKIYGGFVSVLGMLLIIILVCNQFITIPDSFFHGRRAQNSIDMAHELHTIWNVWSWVLIVIPSFLCAYWWKWLRGNKSSFHRHVLDIILMTLALYLPVDSVVKPATLNAQSVKRVAHDIAREAVPSGGDIYEYLSENEQKTDEHTHYYELHYYLGNRVQSFLSRPDHGFLIISRDDARQCLPRFEREGYCFTEIYNSGRKPVMKRQIVLYQFSTLTTTPTLTP